MKHIMLALAVVTLLHVNDDGRFEIVGRFADMSDCLEFAGEAPPLSKVCISVDVARF